MRAKNGKWLMGAAIALCVGVGQQNLRAAAADDYNRQNSDMAKLTSTELRQIADTMDQKNFDLTEAIRKAKSQCDGTVIMAQGKVVDAADYSRKLESAGRDHENDNFKTGKRVIFEVTCAEENASAGQMAEKVAVCPDTGDVKLVRASDMYDRYGRPVSDRDRMNQGNTQYDRDRYDTDNDRYQESANHERTWDDWDADGERHEFRNRYADRDNWNWGREDRGAIGTGMLRKGSDVIGANVENSSGENLGKIKDLAIDPTTGEIRYAVLSFGGFWGIGNKLFAVPWTAFQKRADDQYVLNIGKERLKNAPGFEEDNWPNMANQQWGSEVHAFYNVPPYWQNDNTRTDRYSTRIGQYNRTDRGTYDRNNYDQDTYNGGRFSQSQYGSANHRMFARALERNDFELTDAIKKAEEQTSGQAVSAQCRLASSTTQTGYRNTPSQNQDEDEDFDTTNTDRYDTDNQTTAGNDVIIEVATFTPGNTQNLTIVTISPKTGEVLRTRDQTLSGSRTQRNDASMDRSKLAEGD